MIVPELNKDYVNTLVAQLGLSGQPYYLRCIPDTNAFINECFPNVDSKIKKEGGECILGWQIWETPLIIEAEFHAVWEPLSGERIDITPKTKSFKKILFIDDPKSVYKNKQVNNIRINTTGVDSHIVTPDIF